jgi:MFS family permease
MRHQVRFFYGWVVVATSALGLLFGVFPIVVSSFTIFFKSYLGEFHAGRGAISLALTVHNFFAAFFAAWIGHLTDRFGARKVILPGLGILSLVLLAAETIGSKLWQLYLFYAALGLVSSTTTSVPYGVVVSRWFNRRRGLALGLTMAGLGVGGIVAPPMVQSLIAGYGWRSAFAIAGGAILLVPMPIVGLLLKETPQRMKMLADGEAAMPTAPRQPEGLTWREIRNTPTFWVMIPAFVLAAASIAACGAHIAALFSDRGETSASAALAASVVGLALLLGRAGAGFFLDRYFGPRVAVVVFAAAACGMALLWTGLTGVPALVGTFLVGLGFGAEGDIIAYLMSRYFGLRALGVAFGFAFGAFILASGVGPAIMGFAFDHTGSYSAPLAGFSIACLAAAALLGRLGPYRFALTPKVEAPAGTRAGVEV